MFLGAEGGGVGGLLGAVEGPPGADGVAALLDEVVGLVLNSV